MGLEKDTITATRDNQLRRVDRFLKSQSIFGKIIGIATGKVVTEIRDSGITIVTSYMKRRNAGLESTFTFNADGQLTRVFISRLIGRPYLPRTAVSMIGLIREKGEKWHGFKEGRPEEMVQFWERSMGQKIPKSMTIPATIVVV